jgi:hypothetical protein
MQEILIQTILYYLLMILSNNNFIKIIRYKNKFTIYDILCQDTRKENLIH